MAKPNIIWKPLPRQERFLTCPAKEAGYGGARGGGKSDAMIIAPLMGIVEIPNYRALILRRKYVDLERSLILRSHELYRGRAKWDGQHKRWMFPNGGYVEFGHCQRESDVNNYLSAQYEFIGIEQLEQFLEKMYVFFFSLLRTTKEGVKTKMRSTFNPGGIGNNWIRKRFWIHDPNRRQDYIHQIEENVRYPDGHEEKMSYGRAFIPATVYDNDHIMRNNKDYLLSLMALPEPMRTAYMEGRFDLFEGQFFKEWDPKIHVCEPFEIPSHWTRWMSFDWGYRDPSVVLWFAEDPKSKTIFVYRMLKINETIDTEVAKEFAAMSAGEQIQTIFYPWDLDNDNPQTGVSMKERMDDATGRRFYWKEGYKDRKNGWAAVRYLMKPRAGGEPMLKIFNTCKYLIETIPEQVYDESNSEDLDTFGDDHGVDALRYFAATYRPLLEIQAQAQRTDGPIDVGGALLYKNFKLPTGQILPRQFAFKKEEQVTNSWMWE